MSLVQPSGGVFDTCVELDVIERGLRRGLGTAKRSSNTQIERIGENQGFFSRVALLHCHWPEGTQLPSQVAIKLTTLLNTIAMNNRNGTKKNLDFQKKDKMTWSTKAQKLRKWHNNEILFYETIQKLNFPSFVTKMYFGRRFDEENEDVGFICLEYAANCHVKHIHEVFSISEVKKVLDCLVEVQFNMDSVPEAKKNSFTVYPYEELYSDILQPNVLSFRLDELRQLDSRLDPLVSKIENNAMKLISPRLARRINEDLGMKPIFVQGDMYSTNILWKSDENGQSELCKVIDWQLCHYGSAAEDLTRLFITTLSAIDRRDHWEHLLEYYHKSLSERLNSEIFTLEQLKWSYCHFFCLAALAFIGTVPEVFKASLQTCSDAEKRAKTTSMVHKIEGILEDVLYFADRKQG